MNTTDYGKKVGQGLKAVAKMHSQVSQLLSDCDRLFPDYTSVFANTVTRDLTYHVSASFWMAEGVYRYWFKEGQSMLGITVIFHPWEGEIEQPLLIAGSLEYQDISSENIKEQCEAWALFYSVTDWGPKPTRFNEIIELPDPDEKGAISNMSAIIVPLFWIENIEDIKELYTRLGVKFSE